MIDQSGASYFVPPEPSEDFNVFIHTLTPAFRERAEGA